MQPQYINLDIRISGDASPYTIQLESEQFGTLSHQSVLALDERDIELMILKIGRNRRAGTRRIESSEVNAVKTWGSILFRTIFPDDKRDFFYKIQEYAQAQNLVLRLRLQMQGAPELTDLPWEALYDQAHNHFLCLSSEISLIRYLDAPPYTRSIPIRQPLKILLVISSPPDYAPVDIHGEWARLKKSLDKLQTAGLVSITVLNSPTLSTLRQALRQAEFNILHFVGHSAFLKESDDGFLILFDEDGRGKPISGQSIGVLLRDYRHHLRLIVLNSCEGARASRKDSFSGVAQSLIQQGISVVVAMQFEITEEAALAFVNEFYSTLAQAHPIDRAITESRKAIFTELHNVEWLTPVIYTSSLEENSLVIAHAEPKQANEPVVLDAVKVSSTPKPQRQPATPIIALVSVALVLLLLYFNRENISAFLATSGLAPDLTQVEECNTQYVVQDSDTLASLAERFETTTEKLVSLNTLEPNQPLTSGQILTVPNNTGIAHIQHTVVAGETIFQIARDYGVNTRLIANINPNVDFNDLQEGQRFLVPVCD